jgi:hypothetical protein
VIGDQLADTGGGIYWEFAYTKFDVRYIRFHFDQIIAARQPVPDFALRVVEYPAARIVATYTGSAILAGDRFSTGLLPAGSLKIQLMATAKPDGLSIRLARVSWNKASKAAVPQTPIAKYTPVETLAIDAPVRQLAKAVARLQIGPTEATCTGVLVAPDVVATDYHCLDLSWDYRHSPPALGLQPCQDIVVEFDYLSNDSRGISTTCVAVRVASAALDAALLIVDPAKILDNGRPRIPVTRRDAGEGWPTSIFVIHHPLGWPLQVADNCSIVKVIEAAILEHSCDTDRGSSGSPLFDKEMRWIGLHFQGAYPSDATVEQIEEDKIRFGPKYNHARSAALVEQLGR